jgi:dTMP kinase
MMSTGHFIVVEGLEGAGKSTAMNTIKRFLAADGVEIITTREPGGTRVGEAARQLIKESMPTEPLDPRSELLLLYASRVQLLERVIRPALERGAFVIADRFELSTWAYQGGGRQLDREMIAHLSSFCLNDLKPDLVIFLEISPQQGLMRALKRGKADRIEQESLSFFTDVHQAYQERIKAMSNVVVIDASKPLGVVQKLIRLALEQYLQTKPSW